MSKRTVHFLFDKPQILFFGWNIDDEFTHNGKCYLVADKSKDIRDLLTKNESIERIIFNGDELKKKCEPILKDIFSKSKRKKWTERSFPDAIKTNDELENAIEAWIEKQSCSGLDAIWNNESKILILGTFPGEESLKKDKLCKEDGIDNRCKYYSNKDNLFWEIISSSSQNKSIPQSDSDKRKILDQMHIALWDIYERAYRIGSKDENILYATYNDIFKRLEGSSITTVILTGVSGWSKMHHLAFLQYFHKEVEEAKLKGIKFISLPSTSSRGDANREKVKNVWKSYIKKIG